MSALPLRAAVVEVGGGGRGEQHSGAEPPPWPCLSPGGLASEKDYPFQGQVKPHRCLAKKHKKVAWIQDFIMLPDNEQSAGRGETRAGMGGEGQGQTDQDRDKQTGLQTEMEGQRGGGWGREVEPRAKNKGHRASKA